MEPLRTPSPVHPELCVNLCEIASPGVSANELEELMAKVCAEAGFPYCERIYVGSYFCDNYFCALDANFHEAVRKLCRRHDLRATLIVPVFGQARLDEGEQLVDDALDRFGDVYDEVAANDIARFLDLNARHEQRLGLGRLFSKVMRDARVDQLIGGVALPELSAEARECIDALHARGNAPVIELDPTASTVDASRIVETAPDATIAMHLPYCYATTGRNCTVASMAKPVEAKFHLGRPCELQCLDMRQTWRTCEGTPYVKHGRTFFFENPDCAIAGVSTWRIIHA